MSTDDQLTKFHELGIEPSNECRMRYVDTFINTQTEYFRHRIKNALSPDNDGYLWDCVACPTIIRFDQPAGELERRVRIFLLADYRPGRTMQGQMSQRLLRGRAFETAALDVLLALAWLPDDIYLFDEGLT